MNVIDEDVELREESRGFGTHRACATTMLKNGLCLLPKRASRIRTTMASIVAGVRDEYDLESARRRQNGLSAKVQGEAENWMIRVSLIRVSVGGG